MLTLKNHFPRASGGEPPLQTLKGSNSTPYFPRANGGEPLEQDGEKLPAPSIPRVSGGILYYQTIN